MAGVWCQHGFPAAGAGRDAGAGRLRNRLVADGLAEHGVDDQVRGSDPARGQALAPHRGDDLLDVLASDDPDRPVSDRRVDVAA
jgi:hypothetical protein